MTNFVKWQKQGCILPALFAMAIFANMPKDGFAENTEKVLANEKGAFKIQRKIKLGGVGSWDYLTIDKAARRLYIGRSNRVMIVDMDSDKLLREIGEMEGVHGVTLVPEFKKIFVTCGRQNLVKVFDLSTFKVIAEIKTGKNPDASLYDPGTKRVFIFNNDDTTTTVIDAASEKVIANLEIGGSPEAGVADGADKIYVNLEDKSEIAVIDAKALKVLAHWSLAPGDEPTGIAIDTRHHRLFSGCHNKLMMILDSDTGKAVCKMPIGKGVDGIAFDPVSERAFASNGDGTLTVVREKDSNSFFVEQTIATQVGARTMAFDQEKKQIWLVTATPKNVPPAAEGEHKHHSYEPDSFTAIVVGER